MKRRRFLKSDPARRAGPCCRVALGGGVAVCARRLQGEPASGPVDVKWDRETDPRCGMVISDRRFAAQIRDPGWQGLEVRRHRLRHLLAGAAAVPRKPRRRTEYWVADYRSGAWLDARQAYYLRAEEPDGLSLRRPPPPPRRGRSPTPR
jgi:copper chaperone NosL